MAGASLYIGFVSDEEEIKERKEMVSRRINEASRNLSTAATHCFIDGKSPPRGTPLNNIPHGTFKPSSHVSSLLEKRGEM